MSQKQATSGRAQGKLPFAPEGWPDSEIPAGFGLNVKVGEHVTDGKTIIARKVEK